MTDDKIALRALLEKGADATTHRRNGRKLLFTEADYARLLDSFVPMPPESRLEIVAATSNEGASRHLTALIAKQLKRHRDKRKWSFPA